MANNFYVDYSLVASSKVTSNYIELWDKVRPCFTL